MPHLVSLINAVVAIIVLLGVFIYKYVFPKRNISLFILLILISLVPLISVFRPGAYESGDMALHVKWLMVFDKSLHEGNIVPSWGDGLFYGYGSPLFIFIYILPYYIGSFIHFFGFSYLLSFKLMISLCFVISGIGMYLWIREKINNIAAFTAAIFYLFAPYHLIDMQFRTAVGELVAFAILPFCFMIIDKYFISLKQRYAFLFSIFFCLLLLSHPAIGFVSFFIFIIYILFYSWQKKLQFRHILLIFVFLGFGLLISSFHTLPTIFEAKYDASAPNSLVSFLSLSDILFSPYRYGFLFQGPKGQLALIIGYTQMFSILLTIFFLIKNKFFRKEKIEVIFFLIISFFTIFMLLPYSKFIWEHGIFLQGFQFTYRLLLLLNLLTAVLAGYVVAKISKKSLIYIFCFITIFYTFLNWGNRNTLPGLNDIGISSTIPTGLTPPISIWYKPKIFPINKIEQAHIDVINGKATIREYKRLTNSHRYSINITTSTAVIRENTAYFPGWKLTVDGKPESINYSNKMQPGIIFFSLKKGEHLVNLKFVDTLVVILGKITTMITLSLSLLLLGVLKFTKLNVYFLANNKTKTKRAKKNKTNLK